VTHGGKTPRAHAVLVEDPHKVAGAHAAILQRHGRNAAQRQPGVTTGAGRAPTQDEPVQAVASTCH
jgi:hypothetical protein